MAWLKSIIQLIIAIPQIARLLVDAWRAVQSAKAKAEYDKAKKENKKISEDLVKAETKEEAQAALDAAAQKWGSRRN